MERPVRVLFLCTGNACRSQMAEAWLRRLGGERFEAFSAGSHPAGFIHPLATDAMKKFGLSLAGQSSKSWNEFAGQTLDLAITLCDFAANEPCPVTEGGTPTVHWSLPDPAYFPGTDAERLEFAVRVADRLRHKIEGLVAIDWSAAPAVWLERLKFLGEI